MIKDLLRKNQPLRAFYRSLKGHPPIFLDYDVDFKPRWTDGDGHPALAKIISAQKDAYEQTLNEMAAYAETMQHIKDESFMVKINMHNGFLPATDGLSLMWAAGQTKNKFIEVGSGTSTLYFKAGLIHHQKNVEIISIDPQPRREVDKVCDKVIRQPVENIDLSIFDTLEAGDTVFIDNSHRSFMNSDVTAVMLDILPRLKSGVLIGIHDIFLPFDYFEHWAERAYNEQYLLACYLLANPDYFDIRLANFWAAKQGMHFKALENVWNILQDDKLRDRNGSAFWAVKN